MQMAEKSGSKPTSKKGTTSRPGGRKSSKKTKGASKNDAISTETKPSIVQSSITDYFSVRRSGRRCQSDVEKEKNERILQKLRDKDEEGLEAVEIEGKGRGVKATRKFIKGELICEYSGDLIYIDEAKKREKDYQKDIDIGCYMYYFNFKDKQYCVDATKDNKRFGRLLNHCKKSPNVITKVIPDGSHPYLCLMAMRDIKVGEELVYDYGERDKTAIESHPWLTS